MNAVDLAVVILAASVPLTALGVAAAFWFMFKQQDKHLLGVLDRFLSRNMSEYGMTDLVKREIEADQGEEVSDDSAEDSAFETYLKERNAAAAIVGAGE